MYCVMIISEDGACVIQHRYIDVHIKKIKKIPLLTSMRDSPGGGTVYSYMERPKETNEGQSGADVLLCTFGSTNAGYSSFPERKLLS